MLLRDLSLVYKIPLRVALLIVFVGLVVTASLLFRAYSLFKDDLLLSSENMARVLSRTLTPAILHDDVWKAYEIINTPFAIATKEGSLQAEFVLVLDNEHKVYVSTQPEQYPMLTDPAIDDDEIAKIVEHISQGENLIHYPMEQLGFENLYILMPIENDGVVLGTLIMGYSKELFSDRFLAFARLATITTLLIMGLLIPLGVYWGRGTAKPLIELSDCMRQVGTTPPDQIDCKTHQSGDEIGELGRQFQSMVSELREKSELERQMIVAERLAAIGRFTSGIAHEINNPLGGMLNAINTLRKHGENDPLTEKTISLLERGLLQVKQTVAALLVEASSEVHPVTYQDIEDTRTLVQQEAAKKYAHFNWHNAVSSYLPLPSTMVRQIMINLLLNAIQAVPKNGRVTCNVSVENGCLKIQVENEGKQISVDQLNHLFEPFTTDKHKGRGLGLWVTYQIVDKLKGDIQVSSGEEDTRFMVTLPLKEAA